MTFYFKSETNIKIVYGLKVIFKMARLVDAKLIPVFLFFSSIQLYRNGFPYVTYLFLFLIKKIKTRILFSVLCYDLNRNVYGRKYI